MPFQTGFIAHRVLDPQGKTPLSGVKVKVKASVPFPVDTETHSTIISERGVTAVTDADGRVLIEVPASDSTGINPAGVTYTLTANTRPRPFTVVGIFVPAGVTVQAADVAPAPDAPQYAVQVTRAEFDALAATVGAGGGGGGAVSSVNTKTGDVVLVATDVGAETPSGAQTKATAARDAAITAAATDATTKVAAASTTDRDRANHTGTQTSATISDFAEAAQDAVAAALQGVTGATVTYNDAANTITITGVGDPETMRDVIGVALVGVGNITVSVNDAADTITISTTATANSTDAALRDRSTHTGTQSADTLTDGTTNKAFLATERTKLTNVATGATANATDAQLRDRTTHTGTQSLDTTVDSATRLALTTAERAAIVAALPQTLVDAKGDLIVGTANDTLTRLAVGTDGQVLTADAATAPGVKWATPAAGGGASPAANRPAIVGHVIYDSGVTFNSVDLGEGVWQGIVDFLPAGTYDAVVVGIGSAGSAGAVARVVAYADTPGTGPTGAPVVNVTAAATSASTYAVITLGTPLVWPGGLLWRGIVAQGGATTRPSFFRVIGMGATQHVALAGQFINDTSPVAAKATISGTPPTNPTITWDRTAHRVGFRRSA